MTAPWLHIIGVGEGGVAELPPAHRLIISYAEVVLAPPRFLADLAPVVDSLPRELLSPDLVSRRNFEAVARALLDSGEDLPATVDGDRRRLVAWEPPLESMLAQVTALRGTPAVILATGDPLWFGIGATLADRLDAGEFVVHPHPSAFQLAAARLRWPLQHLAAISLHGRPVEAVQPHILPGNRILALTSDASTVDRVCDILANRGYGQSRVTTLEHLGGAEERLITATAETYVARGLGDFYVLAVDCVADADAALLPAVPGLPEDAFVTDGQVTKREVRAATLARLAPYPGALLWDVGAGCGSVAIEWMRAARGARAIAFERRSDRRRMIASNAAALGTPTLRIETGTAPAAFAAMPAPDAVFLGGGIADEDLFEACWEALKPGGRLVANAVTLAGEQALIDRHDRLGGDLARIAIATLDGIGGHRVLRPRLPVTQWAVQKPLRRPPAVP